MNPRILAAGLAVASFLGTAVLAEGIPEPGLTLYGTVRNMSEADARLTSGLIECTVTPTEGGASVAVTAPLEDLAGTYSYRLRVPFETLVGSTILSPDGLQATAANSTYQRSVVLIINGNRLSPQTQPVPFQFKSGDHAKVEELNLYVEAGVGLHSIPRFSDRDGDGLSDADEVRAGTNPDDPADHLRFVRLTYFPGQGILLEWTSTAGREYTIHRCAGSLDKNEFRVLQDGLRATPRVNGFLDRTAAKEGPYFYRVSVK